MRRGGSRGMALINALIVVAALSAISVALLLRADQARQRLADLGGADQAQLYLDAAALLVRFVLESGAGEDAEGIVHSGQPWAEARSDEPIDRGHVSWQIADLQGRFNINWLATAAAPPDVLRASFEQLLRAQGLSTGLSRRLADALDPEAGRRTTAFGRETRPPPLPLHSVRALRLVEGMDDTTLAALTPLLAALPGSSTLNVNTAGAEVLAAFLPGVSAAALESRLAGARPFETVDAFLDWSIDTLGIEAEEALEVLPLDVGSEWFEARLAARLDMFALRRTLVLRRAPDGGRSMIVLSVPEFD